jgi:hypothetical protein
MHLAFVTDGSSYQLVGITGILHELHISGSRFQLAIVAPCPEWSRVSEWVEKIAKLKVAHFADTAAKRADDPYSIQMDLSGIFTRLGADEHILCLDYDHLLLKPCPPSIEPSGSCIMVSSEVNSDVQLQMITPTRRPDFSLQNNRGNTSLISGRAEVLKRVANLWIEAYNDLADFVKPRFRTEIAFTLAAERAGVSLAAAPVSIQASVATPDLECWVFHFGGESPKARELKALLRAESERLGATVPSVQQVLRIHTRLKANLSAWCSDV